MKTAFAYPALDEEAHLRRTVERTLHMMDRLVIIDDGSTDRTGEIATELAREHPDKIDVIHHPENVGVGSAVKSAFRLLLARGDMDAIGVIPGGDPCEPDLVRQFREVLETTPEVDVAKGSRFMHAPSRHEMPALRRWRDRGASTALQLALGFWGMDDVLHGYFLARTDLMRQMDLDAVADGYDLEQTMMVEFRRLRATFALVPSPSDEGAHRRKPPHTLAAVSSMVARRAVQGPDRLGLALLLMSVPTFGASLPFALLRIKRTSPKVTKLR